MIRRRKVSGGLATALAAWSGRPFTVIEKSRTELTQTLGGSLPYGLLEPVAGMTFAENFVRVYNDAELSYRVMSIGQTIDQAEALADRVRAKFLDFRNNPVVIDGYTVMSRKPDGGPGEPNEITKDLWSVEEMFTIRVCVS